MKKFTTAFCFLVSVSFSFAETPKTDSLLVLLKKSNPDTIKLNILHQLFFEYEFDNRNKAEKFAFEALSLANKINHIKGQIQSLTYLGYLEQDIGNFDKAVLYHNQALKFAEKHNYIPGVSIALGNIGSIYHQKAEYPQALSFYLRSLKIDEVLDDKPALSTDYGNIGLVYYDLGELDKAKEYYSKALQIDNLSLDSVSMAQHTGNLASLYHQEEQFEQALQLYVIALKINERLDEKNQIAAMLGNIGEIYHDLAKKEELNSVSSDSLYNQSLNYHFRALKMKEEQEDIKGIAINEGNIGSIFIQKKKYKEAEIHLLKAFDLSKKIDILNILMEVENLLTELYSKTDRYELGLRHYKEYVKLKDSLFNQENAEKITRHAMNYEFEKKEAAFKAEQEKKDVIALEDKRKRHVIIRFAASGVILVIVFACLLFRSNLQKQRANILITHQKEIVEEKQKEILDSIYYASRIQRALLPAEKYIEKKLKELKK